MTINKWLVNSTRSLKYVYIDSARLDCLILLEDTLGKDRSYLLAHHDQILDSKTLAKLNKNIERRKDHTPLAYIRKKVEFYGRAFYVDENVLVPRPESETIIDVLKSLTDTKVKYKIADIGTGSGVIGISAALELPNCEVDLYDISPSALKVASRNAQINNVRTSLIKSDLLTNVGKKYDILLANLPYVPIDFPVSQSVNFEPHVAIYAGKDGLVIYRKFWQQLSNTKKVQPQIILIESFPNQHITQHTLANKAGYRLLKTKDFVQAFGNN
jgi:release factor glutamine methyltransferase